MIIENIHKFFFFLSTNEGTLLKYSFEFLLVTIISYMIISEFMRTKEPEMKFLAIGFGCLSIEKLIASFYIWHYVFGGIPLVLSQSKLPLIDNCLEIMALILFSNAFLYPFFKKRQKTFHKKIRFEFTTTLVAILIVTLVWNSILSSTDAPVNFYVFKGNLLFLILKIFFLLMPVIYLTFSKRRFRYRRDIIAAFLVYAVTPILQLVNFSIFKGSQFQFQGFVHPFPLLSILLFTRIIYHKLVDKVTLQEKLKLSQKKLLEAKEIGKLKDKFVSTVSHELKTPLTSIGLYLSLMKKGELGAVSRQQQKALNILKEETNRLTDMVNDILDLSKLKAKNLQLDLEEVDLSGLLLHHPHYKLAEKKGIKMIKDIPQGFIVMVDLAKFQQICINLLSNAIKYTPKGGTITVSLEESSRNWLFSVEDTGKGVPRDKIPNLFKRFYQVDDPMTRKHGGTGLGLSIVHELVRLHRGRISVKSKVGAGTKFTMVFPKRMSKAS